jgi:hypothetical protein
LCSADALSTLETVTRAAETLSFIRVISRVLTR